MCKRTTTDPLLRPLLDTYRVHPLPLPREGVSIGDVYAHAGRSTSQVGHIAHLLDPAPTLPSITEGERMASVSSARSGSYDFRTGVRFLCGFLTHLRAPASFIGGVRSAYERRSAAALDFKIGDLTRDSVDNGALAVCLGQSMVRADQSLWDERQRHYIVSTVWRASLFCWGPLRGSGPCRQHPHSQGAEIGMVRSLIDQIGRDLTDMVSWRR
jgi:hypothetical protein